MHITETEASDSTAFSCWARMPCRAIFAAVTAAVSETSRIRPSGMMFVIPAVSVCTARCWVTSLSARETPRPIPSGSITPTRMISSRSIARSSGERGWRKRARGPGQLGGVAVGADRGRLQVALALDHEGAREHLVALVAEDRLRLAGQLRLVERDPVGADQLAVGRDLVAVLDPHQVADDDLVDRHLARLAVADDGRLGDDQRRELVEGALRPDLLEGADRDVGGEDREEERVARDCRRSASPRRTPPGSG